MIPQDPLWQFQTTGLAKTFSVLGFDLRLRTNHEAGLQAAALAFGRFKERAAHGMRIDLELVIRDDSNARSIASLERGMSTPNPRPSNPQAHSLSESPDMRSTTTRSGAPAEFYRERQGLYVASTARGEIVIADLEARRAIAYAYSDTQPALMRRMLIESPVWRIIAAAGLTAIHAATIRVDGVSLVLRGPSGSGKSTLSAAHALAARPSEGQSDSRDAIISEEISWVDPSGAEALLRGQAWSARLDEGATAMLQLELEHCDVIDSITGKRRIDLEARGCQCVESGAAGPLVFLGRRPLDRKASPIHPSLNLLRYEDWRAHARPAGFRGWARLSPEQTLEWMQSSFETPEKTQRAEQLDRSARLLADQGGYALDVTRPEETLARIREIAKDHLSASLAR
jgi:energy-coupling factor transporter ATP-binding protein EcfA2